MVYFVMNPELEMVKIGFSENPYVRLQMLRIGSATNLHLAGLMSGGPEQEKELHQKFDHLRVRGEWFKVAPELESLIATCAVAPEEPPKVIIHVDVPRGPHSYVFYDVAAMRAKLGWTQRELALHLGVSSRTIARWEVHDTKLHKIYVERIKQVLKEQETK